MTVTKRQLQQKSKAEVEESDSDLTPDGGWGWIVCFGAFMVNFIADGTMFSFGILFIELLDYFQDSKFKTSIIGSSQLGLSMLMGPIVSILLKRFTCRQVTITGSLISATALLLSIFSPNVEVMIITYGIMCGTGICMMYMTAIIAVGLYFNKKRAIATGIATSGAGVGVFVYGYLVDFLLDEYTWCGTVLILSAIMLNGVVCGAVFRPMKTPLTEFVVHDNASTSSSGYCGSVEERFDSRPNHKEDASGEIDEICCENNVTTSLLSVAKVDKKQHKLKHKSVEDLRHLGNKEVDPRIFVSTCAISKQQVESKTEKIAMGLLHPMLRKDIFYSGSISHLPDYNACGGSLTSFLAQMTREEEVIPPKVTDMSHANSRLKSLYDISIFKDRTLWTLLGICTFWTVQSIPITYVPGLAVSRGIDRSQASLMISVIGIANTIGRIVAGFANDVFQIRSIVLYFVAFCLGATVNFIFPFCESLPLIVVCTAGFGLCMAVSVSMRTIVIADLMSIERLTQSFGLISFAQGIAFVFNPPIAGTLMDLTGNYVSPFFMAAICYSVSGVLSLIILIVKRNKTDKSESESSTV